MKRIVESTVDRNPFIITPGADWFDREELWNRIRDYIELARHTRNNEIIVLTGDYGSGTTHTLKYLKHYLNEKGAVAAYVAMPVEAEIADIYSEFIRDIGYEKRRVILSKLMETLAITIEERDKMGVLIDRPVRMNDIEEVFERFVRTGRFSTTSLTIREREYLRALGVLAKFPSLMELWNLEISVLSTKEWPVFLLVDEFDEAASEWIPRSLLHGLRQLFDDSMHGLCFVFGLKGEPKDAKRKLDKALYSRMSLQPIHLYPISKEEAPTFLKAILQSRGIKEPSSLYPFTEDAIETLVELTCPTTPRRLLRISSLVFEEAHIEGVKKIDKEFVTKIATKYGEISIPSGVQEAQTLLVTTDTEDRETTDIVKSILSSVVEFDADHVPHITVKPEALTARDVIGLLLFATSPSSIDLISLTKLVSRNWKNVDTAYVSANLSQMRHLVIREGKKRESAYRLSGAGESWVKRDLLPELKQVVT